MAQRMTFWKKVACMSPSYQAKPVPLPLPKSPLARLHDPQAQDQVGEGVSNHARSQTPGPIRDKVVKRSANKRSDPISSGMGESEGDCDDEERDPGKCPYGYRRELFADQVAEQETAPENLFDERHNDHEPDKTQQNGDPVHRRSFHKN